MTGWVGQKWSFSAWRNYATTPNFFSSPLKLLTRVWNTRWNKTQAISLFSKQDLNLYPILGYLCINWRGKG